MGESGERQLPLIEDQVGHLVELIVPAGEERSSGDRFHAELPASPHDHLRGFLLNVHCANENIVRPQDVAVLQRRYVHIDELLVPFAGKHRRDRQQAKRRRTRLLREEFQRIAETPKCFRLSWIHQQNFHSSLPQFMSRVAIWLPDAPVALSLRMANNNRKGIVYHLTLPIGTLPSRFNVSATAVLQRAMFGIAVKVAYCRMSRVSDHANEVAVETDVAS